MVEKIKINDHGDVIFTEQDAIELLYSDPEFKIENLFFDDIEQYSNSLKELGIDLPMINKAPQRETLENFDHKNIDILKQFITETGKIIPARVSGITAPEQRKLTKAVKIARFLALIPYTDKQI